MHNLIKQKKIEIFIILLLTITVFFTSVALQDLKSSTFAAVFGLLYTIYAGKGKVICYLFGIISTCCYAFLAFQNALWGTVLLYILYYLPMYFKGIFLWKKNINKQTNTIIKESLNLYTRKKLTAIACILILIVWGILTFFKDKFPLIDSSITVLSLIGMYLTVKRCIEQWIVWTIVNILSVVVWLIIFISGGKTFATVINSLIYLFLGIYFYINWKKELEKSKNKGTNY